MTEVQARARLQTATASGSEPTLSTTEIDQLLALARRVDRYGSAPYQPRVASSSYAVGDYAVPEPRNGHLYKATTAGTTGSGTPIWPTTSSATVTDGSVVWTEAGVDAWVPSYNLDAAIAEGWRWKAGKVAADFNFITDGNRFERAQKYQQCIAQAEQYAGKAVESIRVYGLNGDRSEVYPYVVG